VLKLLAWLGVLFVVCVVAFIAIGLIASLPWWGIMSGLIAIGVVVLWIGTIYDIWRRADLSTGAATLWTIAVILFPILAVIIYFFARPASGEVLYRGETVT
jgi:hypothetical protein